MSLIIQLEPLGRQLKVTIGKYPKNLYALYSIPIVRKGLVVS